MRVQRELAPKKKLFNLQTGRPTTTPLVLNALQLTVLCILSPWFHPFVHISDFSVIFELVTR